MKKILNTCHLSNRVDFPGPGSHIHLLRILEFASDGIKLTKEESTHFDVCRACRLKVIEKLRNLAAPVPAVCGTSMRKAA